MTVAFPDQSEVTPPLLNQAWAAGGEKAGRNLGNFSLAFFFLTLPGSFSWHIDPTPRIANSQFLLLLLLL